MISSLWNWLWQLSLMGAFGVGMLQIFTLTISEQASGQITPDTTLGTESSVVTPNVVIRGLTSDRIDGGAIKGANLFHSFLDFNVGEGRGVYFTNPQGIENILGRVTGANRSEIFGRLGVLGSANLFLINPNGIVFEKNASLDVEGSFVATTASGISLGGQGYFSTTQPQQSNLLSVSPGALFFNQVAAQPGNIINTIEVRGANLQVNSGQTLALIGGNVSIDGGKLVAPSGRVELGGVAGENTVGLFPIGDFFGLNFPQGVPQADVSLSNQAEVNVVSSSGGSIAVNAGNLNISQGSQLLTGISGVGSPNTQAGDIKINATRIAIADGSRISNQVAQNAVGNSGNININADSLSLSNQSFLTTSTNGRINIYVTGLFSATDSDITIAAEQSFGGAIAIRAGDIRLYGDSDITTNVRSGAGSGDNIALNADSIIAFDDSDIQAYAQYGTGGDIYVSSLAFFAQNYKPAPTDIDPRTLDGNNRVDINISGAAAIALADNSFIENSLNELPQNPINTSTLIANSCIARSSRQQQGSFKITGSGGLPTRPEDALMSTYTFGNVRSVSNANPSTNSTRRPWRKGDPIVEPQGVYRLSSGQLVLSRECSD